MTTQDQSAAFEALLEYAENQICTHEDTHRGGVIWEICDACGAKWADDEGGKPAFEWPEEILNARAAIEHFLNQSGQYVTNDASRQAAIDAAIEADRKRRCEPVAKVRDRGFEVVDGKHVPTVLVEFPVDDWESRDRFAAAVDAPQPTEPMNHPEHPLDMVEPVKYPANKIGFEIWAQSHGCLPLDPWDGKANHSWSPATYRHNLTEIAWRAWANKPEVTSEPVKVPSDETVRIVSVIADKIEDGTLFQAGIFSRKELAEKVRALLAHYQSAEDPS